MIAVPQIGRAFLLPRATRFGNGPASPAEASNSTHASAAACVVSGDTANFAPPSIGVVAANPDQVDCLPDRLGVARHLSRGATARAVDDPARAFSPEVQMAGTQARRGSKARLADDTNFRRMWESGVPLAEIAQGVDMATHSVTRLARSYGYPHRTKGGELLGDMPSTLAVDDPDRDKPAEVNVSEQTHPRWPIEYDAAILKTGGKYSRMANLSKSLGRSVNAILGRWHQLRAM